MRLRFIPTCLVLAASAPALFACGPTQPTGVGGAGGTGGTGGGTAKNIPCDVDAVLQSKCRTCHTSPLAGGAPMPLLTYADVTATRSGQPTWKLMQTRIGNNTMPPNAVLSTSEKATLNNWFNAGAPSSTQVCTGTFDPTKIGPEYLPCPQSEQLVMRTYSGSEGGAKYTVTPGQRYVNFSFKNPFLAGGARAGQLAIATAPITDNKAVIHHWILYGLGSTGGGQTHVAGWAPGGNNSVADPDIGQDLSMYSSFQMQTHYYNQTGVNQQDGSGVAFCTTPDNGTRTKAGVFTLGQYFLSIPARSTNFAAPPATCSVQRPMTIIGTSPHMHQIGAGFRTEHQRGGVSLGDLSYIANGDWRFDGQVHYKIPRREVRVGDLLRTTCYYTNPTAATVSFGPNTENEMCFDFMTVIPYTSLLRSCTGAATP